jgi:hypothetical protein
MVEVNGKSEVLLASSNVQRDPETPKTVTYIGVKCKNCGSNIALRPLMADDRSVQIPTIVGPTKVRCLQCEQTYEYCLEDQIQFAGPAPRQSS